MKLDYRKIIYSKLKCKPEPQNTGQITENVHICFSHMGTCQESRIEVVKNSQKPLTK